jgi:hypothetical protein
MKATKKHPVILKAEFILTAEEIQNYNSLPDNMPDNKLSKKQIDLVNNLYYKYIAKNIDNQSWSVPMFEIEKREKWPSGPRVKSHEAKRFILSNLVFLNSQPKLTLEQALIKFYSVIECRPMYSKLVKLVYDINAVKD